MNRIIPLVAALLLFMGAPATHAAAYDEELFREITGTLQCLCGCKSTIKSCPHANCDFAIPARREIAAMLTGGMTGQQVIDAFVKKHGEVILMAPTKEGFNLVGYILPFVAIAAVAALLMKILAAWTSRGAAAPASPATGPAEGAEGEWKSRLRAELDEFDR